MPSESLQWVHPYGGIDIDKDTQKTGYSRLLEQVIAADRMNLDASAVDLVYNLLTKVYNSKTHLFRDLAAPYPTSLEMT